MVLMDVSQKTGSGLFSTSSIRFLSVPFLYKKSCFEYISMHIYYKELLPRCIHTGSMRHRSSAAVIPSHAGAPPKILSPLLSIQRTRISTYIVKDRPALPYSYRSKERSYGHHTPFLISRSCPPTCRPARSSSHPSRARTREQRASISRVKVGIDMK